MDYSALPLDLRLRKVLRYLTLYGPGRTWIKVQQAKHLKRRFEVLDENGAAPRGTAHVGLLGCGAFGFGVVAYFLKRNFGRVLRGVMDLDPHRAASLRQYFGAAYSTADAAKVLGDPDINLVFVASNHASHADYAVRALESGKSVHVEKPHVTSREQLVRLCRALRNSPGRAAIGFNRPSSPLFRRLKSAIDGQEGPIVMNFAVIGHEIGPDHWYARPEEGGRVFGNLCHWIDLACRLVDPRVRHPITVRPTRGGRSDTDCAVTYTFGDGSVAAITFSSRGDTFEGVRERITVQRGNAIAALDDFRRLTIDVGPQRVRVAPLFADHGHEERIRESYRMAGQKEFDRVATVSHAWETGDLMLKTREALESDRTFVVEPYVEERGP